MEIKELFIMCPVKITPILFIRVQHMAFAESLIIPRRGGKSSLFSEEYVKRDICIQ